MKRVLPCLVPLVLLLVGGWVAAEPVLGPASATLKLEARSSRWLTETYTRNRPAQVTVVADDDSLVEIHVYDPTGQLVTRTGGEGERKSCTFLPPRTQAYRIEIRNRAATENRLVVLTH